MKVKRLNAVLILLVLVGVTAGIAAARVSTPQKTTTITFWDAYSTGGAEVQHLEKVIIAIVLLSIAPALVRIAYGWIVPREVTQ